MTTSESAGVPVQQSAAEIPAQRSPAEAEAADSERAPQAAASEPGPQAAASEPAPQATTDAADKPETAPLTGRVVAPANDPRQLEAEIERTRQQLGETVQELASRVDVKSRARAKAAELSGRMKGTTVQARRNAVARAGNVRSQVTSKTGAARQKAISAGAGGRDQLRNRAAAVGAPVWQATPEQVRRAVTKGASGARERWMPLAVAAGVFIVGYLAVRQWNRRSPAPGGASERDIWIRRSPAPGGASERDIWNRRSPAPGRASERDISRQDC
jgi:hypothetical protein